MYGGWVPHSSLVVRVWTGHMEIAPYIAFAGRPPSGGAQGTGGGRRRGAAHVINMPAMEKLISFVYNDQLCSHCQRMITQGAFADDFQFLVSDEELDLLDENASKGIALSYFNNNAFKSAFLRLWNEASVYLTTFGIVILAVRRDLKDWLIKLAEQGEISQHIPVNVVDIAATNKSHGQLTYVQIDVDRYEFDYVPASAEDAAHFDYIVYQDPMRGFPSPVTYDRLDAVGISKTLETLIRPSAPLSGRRKGADLYLRSPFWSLLSRSAHLVEMEENTLDATHIISRPPQVYSKRQAPPLAAENISRVARAQSDAVREAHQYESHYIAEIGFQRGMEFAQRNIQPLPTTQLGIEAGGVSKGEAIRTKMGRAHVNDDFIMLPEDIEMRPIVQPKVTTQLGEWHDYYASTVARAFNIPVEYVKDPPIRRPDVGRGSFTRERVVDQLPTEAVAAQRRSAAWFFSYIYSKTYARFDMNVLSVMAEKITAFERSAVKEALNGREPTKQERRRHFRDLLLKQRSTRPKSYQRREDKEEEAAEKKTKKKGKKGEDGEVRDTVTVNELRDLTFERIIGGQQGLIGTLLFQADVVQNEIGREVEKLDTKIHELRLKTLELMRKDVMDGISSSDSYHRAFDELLGIACSPPKKSDLVAPKASPGEGDEDSSNNSSEEEKESKKEKKTEESKDTENQKSSKKKESDKEKSSKKENSGKDNDKDKKFSSGKGKRKARDDDDDDDDEGSKDGTEKPKKKKQKKQ